MPSVTVIKHKPLFFFLMEMEKTSIGGLLLFSSGLLFLAHVMCSHRGVQTGRLCLGVAVPTHMC